MTDSALYMLQYYDLDGFRHDATKHIPEEFWRALTVKIKKNIKKPVYQVGETFGSRALIGSYVSSGMMDGQFDFNLYFDMRSALAGGNGSFKKLEESLRSSFSYYGRHSLMGNITGNHDIARFISYAGKGLRFDEDDKAAGWSREVKIVDTVGYARLKILTAFLMTSPGVPVIYYGDEIGMPGAGDPDNRRPMQFDKLSTQESSVYNTAKELSTLRRSSMSLMYGSFRTLFLSDNVWVYRRQYFDEKTTVILNMSAKTEKVKVDNVDYQIEANSFKIIK
jgi:glycosidase